MPDDRTEPDQALARARNYGPGSTEAPADVLKWRALLRRSGHPVPARVLSRQLANDGHYPAIDVLHSVSRLLPDLASPAEQQLARAAIAMLSVHDKNHPMVEIGAYRAGSNPLLDRALKLVPEINRFCQQPVDGPVLRADALRALEALVGTQRNG